MIQNAPGSGSIPRQTHQNVAGVPGHVGDGSKLKREPLLADLLLAGPPKDLQLLTTKKWYMSALDTLRVAKKFVLDAQAATYLGQMIAEHPRIIADAQDFAIQPFDKMWIELPFKPFKGALSGHAVLDPMADQQIGYLFDGPVVRVGVLGRGQVFSDDSLARATAGLMAVEYILHRPLSLREEIAFSEEAGTSRMQLDLWFWGQSAMAFIDADGMNSTDGVIEHRGFMKAVPAGRLEANVWDKEGLRALRSNHSFRWASLNPLADKRADKRAIWESMIIGSAGDLRNIIALLLFLNRTKDVHTVKDFGFHPAIIDRKPKTLVAHRVISLKLDPKPMFLKMVAGEGIKRRLHDVRGHFCHDRKARGGCAHGEFRDGDFGEFWTEYEPLKWKCSRCDGKRWWRREHSRGHFEDGMCIQEYAVTK